MNKIKKSLKEFSVSENLKLQVTLETLAGLAVDNSLS